MLYRLSKKIACVTEPQCQDNDIILQQAKLLIFAAYIKNNGTKLQKYNATVQTVQHRY